MIFKNFKTRRVKILLIITFIIVLFFQLYVIITNIIELVYFKNKSQLILSSLSLLLLTLMIMVVSIFYIYVLKESFNETLNEIKKNRINKIINFYYSILYSPFVWLSIFFGLILLFYYKQEIIFNYLNTPNIEKLKFIGLFFAAVIAFWQVLLANKRTSQNDKNIEISLNNSIDQRFKDAIELLGSEKAATRLGAIFALHHLAKETFENKKSYTKSVFEILCSYIREKTNEAEYIIKYANIDDLIKKPSIEIQTIIDILFCLEKERNSYSNYLPDLNNAKLPGANFYGAKLENANFRNSNLENSNLENAKFQNVNFENAKLIFANFENAELENTNLENADLEDANFKYAKFINVEFKYANFRCANFRYANLENEYLCKVKFKELDFSFAIFKNSDFFNATFLDVNFCETILENVDFRKVNLNDVDFRKANLKNTRFVNCTIKKIQIDGANLEGSNLMSVLKGD